MRDRRPPDVNLRSRPQMLEYETIVQQLVRECPGRILDWGCGFGHISHMLKAAGADVASFEYAANLEHDGMRALDRFPDVEAYHSSDPVALPYEAASFDAVLSVGVLEHVHDPDASLDEIGRVLRPGGRLYIFKLPNRFSYLEAIARRAGLYHHGSFPDDRLYTKRSALSLLRRHGYTVEKFRRANMLPLTIPGRATALAGPLIWHANRMLARVPGLNLLATNLDVVGAR
jgi:SAM-dependent methyltransferase